MLMVTTVTDIPTLTGKSALDNNKNYSQDRSDIYVNGDNSDRHTNTDRINSNG